MIPPCTLQGTSVARAAHGTSCRQGVAASWRVSMSTLWKMRLCYDRQDLTIFDIRIYIHIEYRHIRWSPAFGYELTSLTGQGGFPLWHVWESLQPQVFWFLRVAEVANAMAVQSGLEFLDSASLHILKSCCMDSWGLRFPARAVLGAQRPVLHLLGGGVGEIKRC